MYSFFEKLITPFPAQEPEQPPKTLLAFCYHYTKGAWRFLLLMSCVTACIAMMEVSLFAFLGKLVDWLGTYTPATLLQQGRGTLIRMGAIVLVGLPLAVILHSLLVHQTVLGNYPMSVRWRVHRYLMGQSISFYQNDFAGRIATKMMQTSMALRESVMKTLDVLLYVGVYFGGIIIVVAGSDWRLILPFLIWAGLYGCVMLRYIPRLGRIAEVQAEARSQMTGRIVDTYTNIATVKLFSHSRREAAYAQEAMGGFLHTVYPQMRLVTGFITSVWALNALLIFSVTALSIYMWMHGTITAGAITAAIGLVLRLYGMSQWVMWELSGLFENIGTVQDGISTISRPREVIDAPGANPLMVNAGEIRFERVKFHYGKGNGVIEDFSLRLRPGERIGFVGRSGAGKSTLVNLLLRFHDLEGGRILIDGQDISNVTQESLRANIAMVTQDTALLHRSVRDNLLYGRPDATEEEMIAAARQAKAHDFILELQDSRGRRGYDAHVGERGVKLSGGQRQRIAIARVLLKNAPILILDEATSALDSEVEAAIQENLYKMMHGKTVIAIAHRLSTIAELERLIVLDSGGIAEQGSHRELLLKKGLYAQLWSHQSGGFLADEVEEKIRAVN
ncbi:MAG TPA: ABC transporter ATP-binding protein [Gammaproteobacteria bacterium]|nr:ABC transporter ATP-binding protein [Gammaproteobacteria bacterium]